jgi:hypothetical protein
MKNEKPTSLLDHQKNKQDNGTIMGERFSGFGRWRSPILDLPGKTPKIRFQKQAPPLL